MNQSLLFAAFCYTAPFILLPFFWPFIMLFGAFLFWGLKKSQSWHDLLSFSALIWTLHLLAIADTLIYMAPSGYKALIPACALLFYTITCCFAWLLATKKIINVITSKTLQLAAWTLCLWIYLVFIDQIQFFPLGRLEGNIFASPLLPLAAYPTLLAPLCSLPHSLILLIFCLASSLITLSWISRSIAPLSPILCLYTLWFLAGSSSNQPEPPGWLNGIAHLPLTIPSSSSVHAGCALISHEIAKLKRQHPHLHTIIMPESAWNHSLLQATDSLPFITIENFFIGGVDGPNESFNTIFQFTQSRLAKKTAKRHAMPITERTIDWMPISNLYFDKSPPIKAASSPRPLHQLDPIGPLAVYICSELFFFPKPDDLYGCPILCVASDWWIRMPHFANLMALAARLKAMLWHRPILYISYRHAHYFTQNGKRLPIASS